MKHAPQPAAMFPIPTANVPYTIRPAVEADAGVIRKLVRGERLDPSAVDWHYFTVLEIEQDARPFIVAIAMVRPEGETENGHPFYELDSVTTRREFRGRGYAAAVVRAAIERPVEGEHPRPLYLLAETDLVAYYQKLGFRIFERTVPDGDLAPAAMYEQADWVNRMFARYTTYHVMGMLK